MASMESVFAAYHARQAILVANTSNPFARGVAWIEGSYIPLHEARIPLLDQGFLHSDLTYDVPSVWNGRYFRLDDHLARLEASCAKIRLSLPLPKAEIRRILVDMVAKSGIRDAFVEVIVTRGLVGVRGSKTGNVVNRLYMFAQPYVWAMEPDVQKVGGSAVIARTVRRISPGSMDPTVKNLQWGDLTKGILEAMDRDATYPLLTDGDTNITEGSGFNVFFVKGHTLYTPLRGVLEGITRRSVLEVAKINNLEVRVELVPVDLAYSCDEIFLSSTAGGIMPITTLDGRPIKDGQVGHITRRIWDGYWAMHDDARYSFEVEYGESPTKVPGMFAKL